MLEPRELRIQHKPEFNFQSENAIIRTANRKKILHVNGND